MAIEHFTKDHEWIRVDGGVATVGITAPRAEQLGDVVFVEVPEVGRKVAAGRGGGRGRERQGGERRLSRRCPARWSRPTATSPPAGPVNEDAEGKAWFFKLKVANPAELDALMDRAAYEAVRRRRAR